VHILEMGIVGVLPGKQGERLQNIAILLIQNHLN